MINSQRVSFIDVRLKNEQHAEDTRRGAKNNRLVVARGKNLDAGGRCFAITGGSVETL